MKFKYTEDILRSLITRDSEVTPIKDILEWIDELNNSTYVRLTKISLDECSGWELNDKGVIQNDLGTFFKISGLRSKINDDLVEQPILLQEEIGFLGIICKKIDGVYHFLMQAKIEPGNINKIQISPTLQATKSNFKQKHGGRKPKYLEFFENAKEYEILYDQIQSEQSARFLGKRNRNIVIDVGETDVLVEKNWKWMTLGQIKELLNYDNLVNMDTRTVLSGLPIFVEECEAKPSWFNDQLLFNSLKDSNIDYISRIYNYINDFKMFNDVTRQTIDLRKLRDWEFTETEIRHIDDYNFKVVFYEMEIEGREVKKWHQPLFEAIGIAKFILVTTVIDNKMMFLVKATYEPGAFDLMELGPSLQKEANDKTISNELEKLILSRVENNTNITRDVMLSEEGGRFYHEENRNIILDIEFETLEKYLNDLDGYFLVDFSTLNRLMRVNNVLNIQLRNLLSLIDIKKEKK
ncbi:MAG TPA: NDP-hexose 2,3-dehydratase family protein [Tissierellaceae bacterium]